MIKFSNSCRSKLRVESPSILMSDSSVVECSGNQYSIIAAFWRTKDYCCIHSLCICVTSNSKYKSDYTKKSVKFKESIHGKIIEHIIARILSLQLDKIYN